MNLYVITLAFPILVEFDGIKDVKEANLSVYILNMLMFPKSVFDLLLLFFYKFSLI